MAQTLVDQQWHLVKQRLAKNQKRPVKRSPAGQRSEFSGWTTRIIEEFRALLRK